MTSGNKNTRFKITRRYSEEPISKAEWGNLEDLLARLIAQAFAAEHPELFSIDAGKPEREQNSFSNIDGDENETTNSITGTEEPEAA